MFCLHCAIVQLLQIKDEYLSLLERVGAEEQACADVMGTTLEQAKGTLCIFTVAQATAKKLNPGETRPEVFSSVLDQAKSSPYWSSFGQDLLDSIEEFKKSVESDEKTGEEAVKVRV